jgi:hypothetical protein
MVVHFKFPSISSLINIDVMPILDNFKLCFVFNIFSSIALSNSIATTALYVGLSQLTDVFHLLP